MVHLFLILTQYKTLKTRVNTQNRLGKYTPNTPFFLLFTKTASFNRNPVFTGDTFTSSEGSSSYRRVTCGAYRRQTTKANKQYEKDTVNSKPMRERKSNQNLSDGTGWDMMGQDGTLQHNTPASPNERS